MSKKPNFLMTMKIYKKEYFSFQTVSNKFHSTTSNSLIAGLSAYATHSRWMIVTGIDSYRARIRKVRRLSTYSHARGLLRPAWLSAAAKGGTATLCEIL